jgi:anti-sigma factor (TIGR02949 family)
MGMTTSLTCEQAVVQLFGYLDRALAGEALEDLEAHLERCLSCCDKLAFSKTLDDFIKSRLPDQPVPEGLASRVRQALDHAAGGA